MNNHTTQTVYRMTSLERQELRTAVDRARRAALVAEKQASGRFRGLMVEVHGLNGYKQGCRCADCRLAKTTYQHAYRARRGR